MCQTESGYIFFIFLYFVLNAEDLLEVNMFLEMLWLKKAFRAASMFF